MTDADQLRDDGLTRLRRVLTSFQDEGVTTTSFDVRMVLDALDAAEVRGHNNACATVISVIELVKKIPGANEGVLDVLIAEIKLLALDLVSNIDVLSTSAIFTKIGLLDALSILRHRAVRVDIVANTSQMYTRPLFGCALVGSRRGL